ncbi:hypothetical protein C8R42DRAFT_441403 [Lentinula raphanica]|nr:hypothetical protein C8R42DRAFT_441403 [Lentinula raphanica]
MWRALVHFVCVFMPPYLSCPFTGTPHLEFELDPKSVSTSSSLLVIKSDLNRRRWYYPSLLFVSSVF